MHPRGTSAVFFSVNARKKEHNFNFEPQKAAFWMCVDRTKYLIFNNDTFGVYAGSL